MNRRHHVVAGLALLLLISCSSYPPVHTDQTPYLPPVDWRFEDWEMDRWITARIQRRLWSDPLPETDIELAYARAVTFRGPPDSIGLDEFLDLSDDQQSARRRGAAQFHLQARLRVQAVIDRHNLLGRGGRFREFGYSNKAQRTTVTRTIGELVQATGRDPSSVAAWTQLGYLAGAVGDRDRQRQALQAALAAARATDGRQDADLRMTCWRVRRDLAWLDRETGREAACLAQLDTLAAMIEEGAAVEPADRREALLLRGLVAAERGQANEAQRAAQTLVRVPVLQRTSRALRDGFATIQKPSKGFDKSRWKEVSSDFMARWILAWLELAEGRTQDAVRRLVGLPEGLELPPGLGHRFWQDAGLVLEAAGQTRQAREAYVAAAVYGPFAASFPSGPFNGQPRVHGQTGADGLYFLGHHRDFLAGSLFGYGANLGQFWEMAEPGPEKDRLERETLRWLDACVNRGLQVPAALALRGRMRLLQGYAGMALDDLGAAVAHQEAGEPVAETLLDLGVAQLLLQDIGGALATLERYGELRPLDAIGHTLRGVAFAVLSRYDEALEELTVAIELDPDYGQSWYNRALVLLNSGCADDAHEQFRIAMDLLPEDPRIHQMMAVADSLRTGSAEPLPEIPPEESGTDSP